MKESRPKTIFCDIDGTLVRHSSPLKTTSPDFKMEILPGTLDKLIEWDRMGYNIILITGRREGARKETERQLSESGIIYDKLIMGVGGGMRYVINDRKPKGEEDYAHAINLTRNEGIINIKI
jgi:hydroxymethylpyrimidine pyrophosphatase-like HAD family hydrolase